MKKENKNIERLFQEKFKDFEVSPPDFIWENIQEKLHPKEKKRRVLPFWFKTAGIAASFVAIVSVVFYNMGNDFKNTNANSNSNSVVNSETTKDNNNGNQNVVGTNASESNTNQNKSNSTFSNETESNSKSNSLVTTHSTEKNSVSSKTNSKLKKGAAQNTTLNESNNSFVSNQNQTNKQNTSLKNSKTEFKTSNSEIVATGNNRNKVKKSIKTNSQFNNFNTTKNNISNSEITALNKFNSTKNKTLNLGLTDLNNSKSSNTTLKSIDEINGVIVETSTENNTTSTAVVAVEDIKMDTITLATVTMEENPMEKLLREKEINKKVADEKEKWSKWAVNSYVSPIFFNSFTNGSPLSEEFASNEKTFNNSTSYGVGVAYNINKRLTVKTGISNLNLDFDTENIAFYSTFEDQSKIANTNIERNANSKYLAIKHEKEVSKNAVENQIIQISQNSGNLNQRTQYIEVPLELSYAILNKKFGVAIRGGMSTLFLTENEISIQATDGNMQIGKASNLNDVHFSSNVGLGFSYLFMKNFQLNVEPTLKYQINTFNKNSEDFTPYVIGVNTGISYKF